MKKLCFLLILALLLSLGAYAFAENSVEVIVMDGIPVVVESVRPAARLFAARRSMNAAPESFTLPTALFAIEDGAFEGIDVERVEITENVVSIGARAFADCLRLRELRIPATVEHIDDSALEGCEGVTVYGETGSEAQRFAQAAQVPFVATDAQAETAMSASVVLPYVSF